MLLFLLKVSGRTMHKTQHMAWCFRWKAVGELSCAFSYFWHIHIFPTTWEDGVEERNVEKRRPSWKNDEGPYYFFLSSFLLSGLPLFSKTIDLDRIHVRFSDGWHMQAYKTCGWNNHLLLRTNTAKSITEQRKELIPSFFTRTQRNIL